MTDGPLRQLTSGVHGQRALWHLDQDTAVLDEHVVHRERLVGGRNIASGWSAGGSRTSPVAKAKRERCSAQVIDSAVTAAYALVGAEPTVLVDDQHRIRAVDPCHLHRALRDLV